MLSSARNRPLRILSERLLITKIITALGLALLLVTSAWSAAHSEADGTVSTAGASVAATQADAEVVVGHAAVAPDSGQDVVAATTWVDAGAAVAGAAGCLLGIFCTILLISLIRYVVLRRSAPPLSALPRALPMLIPSHRPFLRPVTLAELSISRT